MKEDLSELKELVAAIKADAAAQKEKAKSESWTRYVSLTAVFLAILSAFGTQRSGAYGSTSIKQLTEVALAQTQASDQWAFYQAKGLKQSVVELQRDQALASGVTGKPIDDLNAKIARYESEKKDIQAVAKAGEERRDAAREKSVHFGDASRDLGLAAMALQVGVAMAGLCLLVKKKWLWYFASIIGVVAGVETVIIFLRV